jgi:hypothetical protein
MTAKIPKHWKIKKLGEIGVFFKGKGVPKNKITDIGFKCLTYGDLYTKYDFVIEGVKSFIDKETALISQEIRYGDICFAGSGETLEDIGKCATFIDDEIGYAGGDIIVFRTEQNPIVMSYLLNSDIAKKQKFSMGQGHSVVHIYSSQLEMLKLPLPPLEEQEKIAEILLNCDKAIRLTTQIITQLKQRNQGLAQQLLTGEKRVKGFEKSVWKEVRLGEIGEVYQPETISQSLLTEKGFKVYGANGVIGYYSKYNHENEQIAVVCRGSTCGLVNFTEAKSWITGNAMVINLDGNPNYSKLFVYEYLKNDNLNYLITGSGQPQITSEIKKHIIKVPSLKEQNAIAQILDTAHQELKLYEQKLQLLQAQKKTLMQKLLTGEVLTIK